MKVLAENRKARFHYEFLETHEAGIELLGTEVKSIKSGRLNISGSHGIVRNNEAWLLNAEVPAYQPKNAPTDYDPKRTRRLLLHQSEIKTLAGKLREKGSSFIPVRAYLKNGLIKIEMGLGKSRKQKDKRELLKSRDARREMREGS